MQGSEVVVVSIYSFFCFDWQPCLHKSSLIGGELTES